MAVRGKSTMADTSTLDKPGVFAGKLPPLVKRFYLQIALVLALILSMVANAARIWPDRSYGAMVMVLVFLAFFLTLACRLFAESRGWNSARYLALSAGATALLALPLFLGNTIEFSVKYPTLPLLCASIALLVLAAPFLGRDHTNEALWEYNRATLSGMISGLAITILLGAGILAAIVVTGKLPGLDIPSELLGIPFAVYMSFVVIWQLLAGLPRQFDATPTDPAPKWLSRLSNTVIVPVVAVGLAALLLYLVGLFASATLPLSKVGWTIAGFAIFVVVAHFVSWPLRDTGGRALRLFHKHYRYVLLAPVIVLTLDAGLRVADSGLTAVSYVNGFYAKSGLTEGRYLMLMLAFWLGATALYHSLPTQRRLVVAPAMLAALLFAASFGPWGATGLTTRLQLSQLEKQLTTYELLVEGKIVPAEAFIETEKMQSLTGTLSLFKGKDKTKTLEAWFADHGLALENGNRTGAIMESMGLQYVNEWQDSPSFDFAGSHQDLLAVEGFSYMGILTRYLADNNTFMPIPGARVETRLNRENGTFTVRSGKNERVVFDVAALAQRLRRERASWDSNSADQPITLDGSSESGRLTVRLHIESIEGNLVDGAPIVNYVYGTVLWRENPTPR